MFGGGEVWPLPMCVFNIYPAADSRSAPIVGGTKYYCNTLGVWEGGNPFGMCLQNPNCPYMFRSTLKNRSGSPQPKRQDLRFAPVYYSLFISVGHVVHGLKTHPVVISMPRFHFTGCVPAAAPYRKPRKAAPPPPGGSDEEFRDVSDNASSVPEPCVHY